MPTKRKLNEFYWEVKRVVDGRVVVTTCCCAAAGSTAKGCSVVAGKQDPCRCACHPRRAKK